MIIAAIVLVVIGALLAIFGGVKFRQYTEWEHWADKLKWLTVSIIGISTTGCGLLILLFSIRS